MCPIEKCQCFAQVAPIALTDLTPFLLPTLHLNSHLLCVSIYPRDPNPAILLIHPHPTQVALAIQLKPRSALQRYFQAHSSQQHEITLWQIQLAWRSAMSVNLPPSALNHVAYKPWKLKPAARWNVALRLCTSSTQSSRRFARRRGRQWNRCSGRLSSVKTSSVWLFFEANKD